MPAVTINLGTLSVDGTVTTTPTLPTTLDSVVSGHVATVAGEWSKGTHGDYTKLFSFKTNGKDLDDVVSTDTSYKSDPTKWCSLNYLSGLSLAYEGDAIKFNELPAEGNAHNDIAGDFVRHIAAEILGSVSGADTFSNEAALVTAVKSAATLKTINDNITTKLGSTGNTTQDNGNIAFRAFTAVAAGDDDRFKDIFSGADGADKEVFLPLQADDIIYFGVTLKLSSASNHGIGDNVVADRKYRIKLTLKA